MGTGDAGGVPLFGCTCPLCTQAKQGKGQRRPSSLLLQAGAERLLIDAGRTDLADIIEQHTIKRIILTHYHVDHVQGLFHIRWGVSEQPIPVLGPSDSDNCADLHKHSGILDFSDTFTAFETRQFSSLSVTPVPLHHSKPTLGYCFEYNGTRFAYLTDTLGLPDDTALFLQQWKPTLMVLDCSHPPTDTRVRNHNNLTHAIECHQRIQPEKTYLTHMSHAMDVYRSTANTHLPANIFYASDGLAINIT